MRLEELTIGVLSGGKSSRMGSNKAELEYENKSFIEHILLQTNRFSERLVSVDDKGKYQWLSESKESDFKLVEDEYKDFGPIEGIYQLLKETTSEYCFIIATDMPCLTEKFFQDFANEHHGEDCLVLEVNERPEPLCSIYGKSCIPFLESFREQGLHRPRFLFEKVNTRFIKIEELGYSPSVVSNINTPAEYREFLEETLNVHQRTI